MSCMFSGGIYFMFGTHEDVLLLCLCVPLSVHMQTHSQLSSAHQSLQCDTNKCLDVSLSIILSQ